MAKEQAAANFTFTNCNVYKMIFQLVFQVKNMPNALGTSLCRFYIFVLFICQDDENMPKRDNRDATVKQILVHKFPQHKQLQPKGDLFVDIN